MKDRQPAQGLAGRIRLKKEGTNTWENYFLEINDGATESGTELNKANLLADVTEDKLFGNHNDRTINQAFNELAQSRVRLFNENLYTLYPDTEHPYFAFFDQEISASADNYYKLGGGLTKHYYIVYAGSNLRVYNRLTREFIRTISLSLGDNGYISRLECDLNGDVFLINTASPAAGYLINAANGVQSSVSFLSYLLTQDDNNVWVRSSYEDDGVTYYQFIKCSASTLQHVSSSTAMTAEHFGIGWSIGTVHYELTYTYNNGIIIRIAKWEHLTGTNMASMSEYSISTNYPYHTVINLLWVDPDTNRVYITIKTPNGPYLIGFISLSTFTLTVINEEAGNGNIYYNCHIDSDRAIIRLQHSESPFNQYVAILDVNTGTLTEIDTCTSSYDQRDSYGGLASYDSRWLKDTLVDDAFVIPMLTQLNSNANFINASTNDPINLYIQTSTSTDTLYILNGISYDGSYIFKGYIGSSSLYCLIITDGQELASLDVRYRPGYLKLGRTN